jgi:hypothetical protein
MEVLSNSAHLSSLCVCVRNAVCNVRKFCVFVSKMPKHETERCPVSTLYLVAWHDEFLLKKAVKFALRASCCGAIKFFVIARNNLAQRNPFL